MSGCSKFSYTPRPEAREGEGPGKLSAPYGLLARAFENDGTVSPRDDYKSMCEWDVDTPHGLVEVYDYQVGKCYNPDGLEREQITEWSIAGSGEAVQSVLEILDATARAMASMVEGVAAVLRGVAVELADLGAQYSHDGGVLVTVPIGFAQAIEIDPEPRALEGVSDNDSYGLYARTWDETHGLASEMCLVITTGALVPAAVRMLVKAAETEAERIEKEMGAAERADDETLEES